jgi:hypothetical protein
MRFLQDGMEKVEKRTHHQKRTALFPLFNRRTWYRLAASDMTAACFWLLRTS